MTNFEISLDRLKEVEPQDNWTEADWTHFKTIKLALEKQTPKKINEYNHCPCCGSYNEAIEKRKNTVSKDICYCWHCGQALEFGDGERKENE